VAVTNRAASKVIVRIIDRVRGAAGYALAARLAPHDPSQLNRPRFLVAGEAATRHLSANLAPRIRAC
jgi:hypothetical protein